jgi:hypothetical protein
MSAVDTEPYLNCFISVRSAMVLLLDNINAAGEISAWLVTAITLEHKNRRGLNDNNPSLNMLTQIEDWRRAHQAQIGVAVSIGAFCYALHLWCKQYSVCSYTVLRTSLYRPWSDKICLPLSSDFETDVISEVRLYRPEEREVYRAQEIVEKMNRLSVLLRDSCRLFMDVFRDRLELLPSVPANVHFTFQVWGYQALQMITRLGVVAASCLSVATKGPGDTSTLLSYQRASSRLLKCTDEAYIRSFTMKALCTTLTANINLTVSVATATRVIYLAVLRSFKALYLAHQVNKEEYESSRLFITEYINNFTTINNSDSWRIYLYFVETYAVRLADAYESMYTADGFLIARNALYIR